MSVFIFYGNIVECPSRVKPHDVHLYLECGFLWDSYSCTGSPCAGIWPARIFMESSAQPDPDDLRLYRENQKMCPVKKVSDTLKINTMVYDYDFCASRIGGLEHNRSNHISRDFLLSQCLTPFFGTIIFAVVDVFSTSPRAE